MVNPSNNRLDGSLHQSHECNNKWGVPASPAAASSSTAGFGSIPLKNEPDSSLLYHGRPTSTLNHPPGFTDERNERTRVSEETLPLNGAATTTASVSSPGSQPLSAFSNLSHVLGTSLTESMMWNAPPVSNGTTIGIGADNYSSTFSSNHLATTSVPEDDSLSWHRQTRHSASRLKGASPPKFSVYTAATALNSSANAINRMSVFPSILSTGTSTSPPNEFQTRPPPPPLAIPPSEIKPHRSSNNSLQMIGTNVVEPESSFELAGVHSFVTSSTLGSGGGYHGDEKRLVLSPSSALPSVASNSQSQTTNSRSIHSQATVSQGTSDPSFLWSPNAPEFVFHSELDHSSVTHSSFKSNVSADSDIPGNGSQSDLSTKQAEADIFPFLWDIDRNHPSRMICILRVSWLRAPDVLTACETYGVIESFRSDFSSRGIYFCSYFDIRSAKYAAVELQNVLQRLLVLRRSSEECLVRYCLSLSSSSQFDESQITLTNLPAQIDESHLTDILSSYGTVRYVYPHGINSYLVEFYNIQDAKQALLELDSSQPWGSTAIIETGVRNPVERERGRELLAILSRWRQRMIHNEPGSANGNGNFGPARSSSHHMSMDDPWDGFANNAYSRQLQFQKSTPQLVRGHDGRHQVIMPTMTPTFGNQIMQQAQQLVQGPNGELYMLPASGSFIRQPKQLGSTPRMGNLQTHSQHNPHHQVRCVDKLDRRHLSVGTHETNMPFYSHVVALPDNVSLGSSRSYRSGSSTNEEKDNRHLMLDLEEVENGIDKRTSLMVRNIPNKYTQQMLLSEFGENGHGPGTIDFFYLPIDFKNRCNRGYAFVNFVDYKDILMFHRRYFGKHWRTFNSDKICDITYARIQGKSAMLKRFENSALMEKDEEYKPLVFVSDGSNKGQRIPFPGPSSNTISLSNGETQSR